MADTVVGLPDGGESGSLERAGHVDLANWQVVALVHQNR
jgi:hypothetical protein